MSCMMIDDCPSGGDQTAREPVRHNVVRLPERNVSQPRCFRTSTSYMQELAIFVSPLCSHRYFPTRVSLCANLMRKVYESSFVLFPFLGPFTPSSLSLTPPRTRWSIVRRPIVQLSLLSFATHFQIQPRRWGARTETGHLLSHSGH